MTTSTPGLWLLRFSVRHPKIVLCVVAVGVLYAASFIPRVRLELNARSLIPTDNPELIRSSKAADLFGMQDMIAIGIVNNDSSIYNESTLRRIIRLTENLAKIEGVLAYSIQSLATAPVVSPDEERIEAAPLISERQEFDPETIHHIRAKIEFLNINDGILVARDGSSAGIFAQVEPRADRYRILAQVRELAARESGSEDSIHLSGTALAQAVLGNSAAVDLARLVPAVIIVVAVVLVIAFRSVLPALISLSEIGASLILTVGVMGVLEQPVFVTTLVLPVILIAVGVSDDVYALTHYLDQANGATDATRQQAVVASFAGMLRPIGLTALSTVIGLLSLAATSIESFRVFGVFGALAIIFSTLFTFTLVPALIVLLKPRVTVKARRRTRRRRLILGLIYSLSRAKPWRLLLIGLAVAICAGVLSTQIDVDDTWIKNLPKSSDIARADGILNTRLAGTTTVDLMLHREKSGFNDPENFALLGATEEALANLSFAGAVHSIYTDVVRISAVLRNSKYDDLRKALLRGEASLTKDEIDQALFLIAAATGLPPVDRLANELESARVTVFVRMANYERIEAVLKAANLSSVDGSDGGPEITPFGDGWISYLTVQLLVKGQLYSIALALLTDLLLLSILFRSVKAALIALVPVGFSLMVIFGLLAATATPLGIANSMFAGIAIGIGLDFSIHLTNAYNERVVRGLKRSASLRRALIETGPAIVTSAAAVSAGLFVLALSEVTPNVQLGLTVSLSLLVCAAAALVLVPSLALSGRSERKSSSSADIVERSPVGDGAPLVDR